MLNLWFDTFNEAIFDNALPATELRFSRISHNGVEGYFHPFDRLIEVSDDLEQESEQQAALLHEMVHLWQSCNGHSLRHDARFRKWQALVQERTGLFI